MLLSKPNGLTKCLTRLAQKVEIVNEYDNQKSLRNSKCLVGVWYIKITKIISFRMQNE
jgi:hypothetical protein